MMSRSDTELEPLDLGSTPEEARGGDLALGTSGVAIGTGHSAVVTYIVLPLLFVLVCILGGFRLAQPDDAFLFLPPALVCLVFAAITIVLFIRSGLISIRDWFAHEQPVLKNAANAMLLIVLFAATVQIYNSLLPQRGLPFWVMGFCFFWTLWTDLFADLGSRKTMKSLAAIFGLAFVVNYLVLPNLTAPADGSWLGRLWENPGREALTWLLDLPRYSSATGYIQFFTVAVYLIGLFITPRSTRA